MSIEDRNRMYSDADMERFSIETQTAKKRLKEMGVKPFPETDQLVKVNWYGVAMIYKAEIQKLNKALLRKNYKLKKQARSHKPIPLKYRIFRLFQKFWW